MSKPPKRTLRLFSCGLCGHRLRLGTRRCSACGNPTPLMNRRGTIATLAVVLVAGIVALLV